MERNSLAPQIQKIIQIKESGNYFAARIFMSKVKLDERLIAVTHPEALKSSVILGKISA